MEGLNIVCHHCCPTNPNQKMTRWSQLVAMSMAQLAGRVSLRDIVGNLLATLPPR